MATEDESLYAITPAMREGSGLVEFSRKFPERYFDVAIAEQHAVTFAAGLAVEDKKPIVAIYSTFLQRAYDQLIHDVALQNLDVTFAIDRAGLVGEDGPTHSGNYDLAYLRCIPNMIIMTPSNENETRKLLSTGYKYEGPAAIRYPRGTGPNIQIDKDLETLEIGKSNLVINKDSEIIILNFGALMDVSKNVAEKLDCSLADMRFVKPLDAEFLKKIHDKKLIVTIEDGSRYGGAGSAVQEWFADNNLNVTIKSFGIPDVFIEHASRDEMIRMASLNGDAIFDQIKKLI